MVIPSSEKLQRKVNEAISPVKRELAVQRQNDWRLIKLHLLVGWFIELEHGTQLGNWIYNVTDDDTTNTFRIALAHFKESAYYYLVLIEAEKKMDSMKGSLVELETMVNRILGSIEKIVPSVVLTDTQQETLKYFRKRTFDAFESEIKKRTD